MDIKISGYKITKKLSDFMVLAKDAKNITKAIKIHKFDSNRILTKKERSDLLEMQHSNLLVPSDIIIENGFCYAVYPCSPEGRDVQRFLMCIIFSPYAKLA